MKYVPCFILYNLCHGRRIALKNGKVHRNIMSVESLQVNVVKMHVTGDKSQFYLN
jgi:hypothetical protein